MLHINERITQAKTNPVQLHCFVHGSVKTSLEKSLCLPRALWQVVSRLRMGVNPSLGPEAGALDHGLQSPESGQSWCGAGQLQEARMSQIRDEPLQPQAQRVTFPEQARSCPPRSLNSPGPPSWTCARFLHLGLPPKVLLPIAVTSFYHPLPGFDQHWPSCYYLGVYF